MLINGYRAVVESERYPGTARYIMNPSAPKGEQEYFESNPNTAGGQFEYYINDKLEGHINVTEIAVD